MSGLNLKQIKAIRDRKSDREFIIVFNSGPNTTFKRAWSFLGTGSRFQAKKRLAKAKARRRNEFKKSLLVWHSRFLEENNVKAKNDKEVFDWVEDRLDIKIYDESESFSLMRWSEFEALEKQQWCDGEIKIITEEEWFEMLEVLPPHNWGHYGGVEVFCMSERTSGTFTGQYARVVIDGKTVCGTTTVCVYDKSTWITLESLKKAYEESKE